MWLFSRDQVKKVNKFNLELLFQFKLKVLTYWFFVKLIKRNEKWKVFFIKLSHWIFVKNGASFNFLVIKIDLCKVWIFTSGLTAEKAGLGVIIVNIKRYHKVVCIVVALFCKRGFKMRKTMISKQLLKKRLLRLNFIGYF